jgi:hypothetical protein
MALVDRGLNRRVVQISSVSGGSILNAVLAQYGRCFAELSPEEFDEIAEDVTSAIAYRPALGRRWIGAYLVVLIVCGAASGWALSALNLPDALWLVAVAVGAGVPLLWFGHFVTWRLRRSFFPRHRPRTFGELRESTVEHVFCASDLLTGYPVYVSSWHHGRLWRRTSDIGAFGDLLLTSGELWDGGDLTVAEVVRASAGFPGIPPRRIRVGGRMRDGTMAKRVDRPGTFGGRIQPKATYDDGAVMLLSDGGVINNLGTQTLNEDGFFQGRTGNQPDAALLAVNASARLGARHRWPYYLPGISAICQLWRCMELLNSNSVRPRVAAARAALARRAKSGSYEDPVGLVTDLTEPAKMLELSLAAAIVDDRDNLRRRNPAYERGTAEMLDCVLRFRHEHRVDNVSKEEKAGLVDRLFRMAAALPWDIPNVSGILDHDEIADLTDTSWWRSLTEAEKGQADVAVSTTLGRFSPAVVRALVLRGYVHGYLASLAIEPFSSTELKSGTPATRASQRIGTLAESPSSRGQLL